MAAILPARPKEEGGGPDAGGGGGAAKSVSPTASTDEGEMALCGPAE